VAHRRAGPPARAGQPDRLQAAPLRRVPLGAAQDQRWQDPASRAARRSHARLTAGASAPPRERPGRPLSRGLPHFHTRGNGFRDAGVASISVGSITSPRSPPRMRATSRGRNMSMTEKLPRGGARSTLRVESDLHGDTHWLYMHADAGSGVRPCFRTELMDEMWGYLSAATLPPGARQPGRLRHVVVASDAPAFNLGGDLALFAALIRDKRRDLLLDYARRCIDGVHHLHGGLGGDVRTIALVQGDALGGGMELALACHTIVAEEGVDMGLPEVLFGLFPGMGAYSFLCKRVPPQLAEKLILDGNIRSSDELYRLGVVDVLVPRGGGEAAVRDLIRQQQ